MLDVEKWYAAESQAPQKKLQKGLTYRCRYHTESSTSPTTKGPRPPDQGGTVLLDISSSPKRKGPPGGKVSPRLNLCVTCNRDSLMYKLVQDNRSVLVDVYSGEEIQRFVPCPPNLACKPN